MYQTYFGLNESAFSIAVNPKFLYMSEQHKEALAHLVYGVQGGGFVLLSGEVGTGKTTLVRCLLEQMPGDTEIAYVLNPMADVESLLATICEELGLPSFAREADPTDANKLNTSKPTLKGMMDILQAHLLSNHSNGKKTVLLIDEAQLLSADVLEQIRLLTNLETSTDKLLQIVLVGQPEVNDLLAQPRLRQLSQRITARFHLDALSLTETKLYIEHRLRVAGKKEGHVIFPNTIIKKTHRFSNGIPRLINILCERLLIGAYGHNKFEVDNDVFKRALSEVRTVNSGANSTKNHTQLWLAITTVPVLVLTAYFLFYISSKWQTQTPNRPDIATANIEYLEEVANDSTVHSADMSSIENAHQAEGNSVFLLNKTTAFAKLFDYYAVNVEDESHPCWQTKSHNYSCAKSDFETWRDFEQLNRPAILTLITPEKNFAYALIVGLNSDSVFLVTRSDELVSVKKSEVSTQWNGAVSFLWRKPNGYQKPLVKGSRSPVVAWTAEQFALIDGQSNPITDMEFNARLETRVKIFQRENNITADGILGEQTIMKLNEQTGLAINLIDKLPNN